MNDQKSARDLEADLAAGLWVPCYHGNRFKVARQKLDRLRTEERSAETFQTLAEAQEECRRRNQRKRSKRTA